MSFIYIPQINNRIKYVFNYVFKIYLQSDVELINDDTNTLEQEILISYKNCKENSEIYFAAHQLLFEETIHKQEITCSAYNNHRIFFQVEDLDSALPYDPFALIFYMLTRYEEYLPFEGDEHGRFPAKASLAFQNNFLEQPIVEQAIQDILKCILNKFPSFQYKLPEFQFEISFDVDAPFAFRGKGFIKNLAGGLLMLIKGKITQGFNRLGFTFLGGRDPFDQFYDILLSLDEFDLKAIFFLLMEHKGKHNHSIKYDHYAFDILAEKLARNHILGIHPSYDCTSMQKLKEEQKRFTELTNLQPVISRNHFLKIRLPETYQLLESMGIEHDYSMAFPDQMGFRAGSSRPFPFYDLSKEKQTNITIHPFCLMDATFEYYLKKDSETAILDCYKTIYGNVKGYNGICHLVFHNDLISGYLSSYNWKKIMLEIMVFNESSSRNKSAK